MFNLGALQSISGLVVEYIVAIDVTRVRFPADAYLVPTCCLWAPQAPELPSTFHLPPPSLTSSLPYFLPPLLFPSEARREEAAG